MQWAGGQFRFSQPFADGLYGFIEYQVLAYAEGAPSRALRPGEEVGPAPPSARSDPSGNVMARLWPIALLALYPLAAGPPHNAGP